MPTDSSSPFRIVCPGCLARFPVPDRTLFGKNIRCKKCDTSFVADVVPADGNRRSGNTTTSLPALKGYWVSRQPGEVKGPYTIEKIIEFRDKGLIGPEHNLSKDAVRWSPASSFTEVYPPVSESSPAPPAPKATPSASSSGSRWMISDGGNKEGPYGIDELRDALQAGTINAETLVWKKGLPDWTKLADVPALAPLVAEVGPDEPPPVTDQEEEAPPQIPSPRVKKANRGSLPPSTPPVGELGKGLSIAGMVCGISGLVLTPLSFLIPLLLILVVPLLIVGFVLSHLAIKKIKRGEATGLGMAKAGRICSGCGCVAMLVVVALVFGLLGAIIGTAAIPAFTRSSLAANETAAIGTLRNILSTEAAWQHNDFDGNGIPDYWVADVYGLYACADSAGNSTKAVDGAVAKADKAPRRDMGAKGPSRPFYAVDPPAAPVSKGGYYFLAIAKDEDGKPYAKDENGDGRACENRSKFAFAAVPEVYGSTGVNTYIVNEEGVIYGADRSNFSAVISEWPGADPTTRVPPWRVVQ